jgi:hypothetical protein
VKYLEHRGVAQRQFVAIQMATFSVKSTISPSICSSNVFFVSPDLIVLSAPFHILLFFPGRTDMLRRFLAAGRKQATTVDFDTIPYFADSR